MKNRFITAQLGARMHYAVPQILHSSNMLEHFYTDITADKSWTQFFQLMPNGLLPKEMQRLKARRLPNSILDLTTTFPLLGFEYAFRRVYHKSNVYLNHLWAGDELNKRVLSKGFGKANAIFTYNSAGLPLMREAKKSGLLCVMEQTIAPKKVEMQLLSEMNMRFPEWKGITNNESGHQIMIERELLEWKLADKIICGSEFVKKGIQMAGGDVDKCIVVPYGVADNFRRIDNNYNGLRQLRVLVVGQVGLRKGAPFVLNVAKRLMDKIEVRMAGPIAIPNICRSELAKYVDLLGMIPRNQILDQFHWADVFFLPSVCEGSATVTYEAICAGLPVVCTENTGSIIQNNFDGFVVANMDEDAMVNSLENLADDVNLYKKFVRNVKESASNANLEAYSNRFIEAVS